jgi:hypothetical protein
MSTSVKSPPAQPQQQQQQSQSNNKSSKPLSDHSNQLWINQQRRLSGYIYSALKLMVKYESIELHGLGNAIAMTVELAQHLQNKKYANIIKLFTNSTLPTVSENKITSSSPKPELTIILKRTAIPNLEEEQLILATEDRPATAHD